MRIELRVAFIFFLFTLPCHAQRVKEFLKKGEKEYASKDYQSALRTYRGGLEIYPNDARLNFNAGLTYLSLPNKTESLRYLQTALTIDPEVDEYLYYYLGLSYQSNRQFEKALEFFAEFKRRNKKLSSEVDKKIRQAQFADSLTRIPSNVVVENVGKVINSSFHEYSPLVSLDGNTMVFTSNRPDATVANQSIPNFEDIYISKKVDGEWTMPKKISPNINIKFNDAAASLSADGKTLVLYYEYGGGDIYVSNRTGDEWTKPIPLNENINTPLFWETSAYLTSDGQKLYFTSNRPGGMGNLDIYVSEMDETGDWGKASNLGPVINTAGKEDSPALDPDGTTLYFSSDGHPTMGGTDIFKSEFKDGKWQKPVNLGYPINSVEDDSFFSLAEDRKRAYFSTMREEGNAEIYTLTFIEPEKEIASVIANPSYQVTRTVQPTVTIDSTVSDTRPVASRPPRRSMDYTSNETITTADFSRIFLFFAIGKDDLNAQAIGKLEELHGVLEADPARKILIEGHTDNTGSDLLNKALSVKRANTVARYITRQGINPKRLSLEAYGATRPLVSNDDEREGREINRRIEISEVR